MDSIRVINATADTLAALTSVITLLGMIGFSHKKDKLSLIFILLLICSIIALVNDAIGWILLKTFHPYSLPALLVSTFLVFVFETLWTLLMQYYVISYVATKTPVARGIIIMQLATAAVVLVGTVITQFNGMFYYYDASNDYQRGDYSYTTFFLTIITSAITIGYALKHAPNKSSRRTLASYFFLTIAAIILQYTFAGVVFILISMFLVTQLIYVNMQANRERRLKEKELELANSRIDIMLSQIQPHFLYNALNTIEYLCVQDGKQAAEMVGHFSRYLRENMDSLTQKDLVPFEREINHIGVYLDIEKKRFGNRLNIVYDFEITDFLLPILTIQPIVENSLKHGILEKTQGGTVKLSTRRRLDEVLIVVEDDGIGYNTLDADKTRSHVGLQNVKTRLETQCNGRVAVESAAGVGTITTITIPYLRSTDDESNNS